MAVTDSKAVNCECGPLIFAYTALCLALSQCLHYGVAWVHSPLAPLLCLTLCLLTCRKSSQEAKRFHDMVANMFPDLVEFLLRYGDASERLLTCRNSTKCGNMWVHSPVLPVAWSVAGIHMLPDLVEFLLRYRTQVGGY